MEIKIWEMRTKKNYSLRKLSLRTGISKSSLHRMENNQVPIDLRKLEKIAAALKCEIKDLYESEYEKEKKEKEEMEKLITQREMKKFLEPFNRQKLIELKITTPELIDVKLKDVTIYTSDEVFGLLYNRETLLTAMYNQISYITVNEEKEIAAARLVFKEKTVITFLYKNL